MFDDENEGDDDKADGEESALMPRAQSFQDLGTDPSELLMYEDIDEEDTSEISPLAKQCQEIWNTVQLKSVWRPMVRLLLAM